jgi:CHAD domain-containing protein
MNISQESAAPCTLDRMTSACDTMKQLLLGLVDSKGRIAEEIHAIRKLAKSLRGGFSLFRLKQSSGREIQAVGRLLSSPRDAVSRLNTWNKLAWNGDPRTAAAIAGLLAQQTHSSARRPPPETIAWCLDRVTAACHELTELPPENLAGTFAKGLTRLERRTIKRCRKLDHCAQAGFHKTRKALKAWLGASEFLPDGQVSRNPELDHLAELLGDENDLATLSVWLENHGFTPPFAPDLWKTLQASRRKLQQEAIKDAADLLTTVPN